MSDTIAIFGIWDKSIGIAGVWWSPFKETFWEVLGITSICIAQDVALLGLPPEGYDKAPHDHADPDLILSSGTSTVYWAAVKEFNASHHRRHHHHHRYHQQQHDGVYSGNIRTLLVWNIV